MHLDKDMADLSEASLTEVFKTNDRLKKASEQIAQDLTANKYEIVLLVEKLGFALSSPSLELRVDGTKLLSSTLSHIPKDLLNSVQLDILASFYINRMKDHHNVTPPVLDGVAAIIVMKNLPDAAVMGLLQSMFQNIACQSQVKTDREKIFKIIKVLSESHENVLKLMAGDFIYGVISALDGERDPRNLEFIFTFMPEFIKRFSLLHLYEEMFEVFACYFPIDFNPSKTDPAAITRDSLADKLSYCLVATEEFVEWTIPLALEKLESDLVVAKLDSLELLNLAAQKFSPKTLENYFDEIWSGLKVEIFPGHDNLDIISAGRRTLLSILERASSDPTISRNHQTIVLGSILQHLSDVNHRLFGPSTAIALVCVSGDARFASEKVFNSFLLRLQSEEELKPEDKLKIFYILAQAFKICSLKNALREINPETTGRLHTAFLNELKNEQNPLDLKKAALSCLNESIPALNEANRSLLYQRLVELFTSDDVDIDLGTTLQKIAELNAVELQSHCVDKLVRNFTLFSAVVKRKICTNLLYLIKYQAFSLIVKNLMFSNIFESNSNEVQVIALDTLVTLLQSEEANFIEDLHMNDLIVEKITGLIRSGMLNVPGLERSATVLSLTVRGLPISEQYMIISAHLSSLNLQLLSDLYLAKGLLGYMHQEISIDEHFGKIAEDLVELSLSSDNEDLRQVAHQLLCSLFNKVNNTEANNDILNRIIDELKGEIKNNNVKAVELLSWISKGLMVRGHEAAIHLIETIADLLNDPSLSNAANSAYEVLSCDYPEIHLPVEKFLHKQRFFTVVLSKMTKSVDPISDSHLNAIIHVLKSTSHPVLKMNIERIGPLLFKCLDLNNEHTVRIALEICQNFVTANEPYFDRHLKHLVSQCLNLAQYKDSMKVRITALDLLHEITKYPVFQLLPLKMDVVLGLAPALDDQKRLVRTAAVKARNAWYLIGEPNGDDQ